MSIQRLHPHLHYHIHGGKKEPLLLCDLWAQKGVSWPFWQHPATVAMHPFFLWKGEIEDIRVTQNGFVFFLFVFLSNYILRLDYTS